MNVPSEVVVFICTSIIGFLSLVMHQLVRINSTLSRVCTQHEVTNTAINLRLTALERQEANNRIESENLRRFRSSPQTGESRWDGSASS